jgi:hypothetical protein
VARARLRPDWEVKVYKYWLKPEGEVPTEVGEEAQRMNRLWNNLVSLSIENRSLYEELFREQEEFAKLDDQVKHAETELEELRKALAKQRQKERRRTSALMEPMYKAQSEASARVKSLREQRKEARKKVKEAIKEPLTALYAEMERKKKEILRNAQDEGIYWANGQAVIGDFNAAWRRGLKTDGFPKFHGTKRDWHFVHRFTRGGSPIDSLFSEGLRPPKRVYIEPLPADAYDSTVSQRERKRRARTKAHIQLGGEIVTFRTILHRPIPEEGIVKQVLVIRRKQANLEKWHMCIIVELPPSPPAIKPAPTKAIVLNILDGQGIIHPTGSIEVARILDGKSEIADTIHLPRRLALRMRKINLIKSNMDSHTEFAKTRIVKVLGDGAALSKEDKALLKNWHLARHKRIWAVMRVLEKTAIEPKLLTWLKRWDRGRRLLYHSYSGLQRRTVLDRKWFYHNTAVKILGLAAGGKLIMNDHPRRKYLSKSLAAPDELRDLIVEKAPRYKVSVDLVEELFEGGMD